MAGRRRREPRRIDWREVAAVFAGGAAGAALRVWIGRHLSGAAPDGWPWATFLINVSGAFVLAHVATRLQERLPVSVYRRPLLGTGFCGAYTTFSTLQVEALKMIDAGHGGLAAAYVLSSTAAGLAAVWLATGLARRVRLA